MSSTQSLAGFAAGSGESILFGAGGGRWNSPFEDADLHWELVSLTPGLHIGDLSAPNIGLTAAGDDHHITEGAENNDFSFEPVLWTDADAVPGIYEAAFKLVDESGTFGSSGVVRLRTEVVPEPSALLAFGAGAALLLARRRRKLAVA